MRYYIISGEASGDLHGSNLMKGLFNVDKEAEVRFWGGDLMQAVGGTMVKHYKDGNFMGFAEVLMNIRAISRNMNFCKDDLKKYNPDVLILIDYPGFNLRIAEYAKSIGLKVYYYISPKIWAWKESRIKKIKAFVNEMFVIFPFEIDYFKKFDYPVKYAGNPLLDAVAEHRKKSLSIDEFKSKNELDNRPIIGVLAGSRKQEIDRILPPMLRMIPEYPEYQFVLAAAPSIEPEYYTDYIKGHNIKIVFGQTYDVLNHSYAALITSGTATLETALFNIPQVVCYVASPISYAIGKHFVKIKYISLVNLIMDSPVITELIQHDVNDKRMKMEMDLILKDEANRTKMLNQYDELHKILGGEGASSRVAKLMIDTLSNNSEV